MKVKSDYKWDVYLLSDPRDITPKYVGATITGATARLNSHISTSKAKQENEKDEWIVELLRWNLRPIIFILQSGKNINGWALAEKQWMALYEAKRIRLLNISDGGIGCYPRVVTDRHRAKISTGKRNSGYRHSEATRKRISEVQIGRVHTKEAKANMKAAQVLRREAEVVNGIRPPKVIKRKFTVEERRVVTANNGRLQSKRVMAIESGEIFKSQKDAARSMNCKDCSIRKAIRTGQRCKGFHWKRV